MKRMQLFSLYMALVLPHGPGFAQFIDDESAKMGMEEGLNRMAGLKLAEGYSLKLWAANPNLKNPVAICFDEKNRMYVAESYRKGQGTLDNRSISFIVNTDLACDTLEDSLNRYKQWAHKLGGMGRFTKQSERIVMLSDTDGDGVADTRSVYADKFDEVLTGGGAGVIARDGTVYYTCIPDLWKLRDEDGDGKADLRESMSYGYGIRIALSAHDMHGLAWGPDGKLYWSIGDRGFNVQTPDGRILRDPIDVGRGAVFRCNRDGTELEVYHWGLRNPEELAFDQYGNLFTGDNNSDAGDRARLVYLIEGGDSGWAMSYQSMDGEYKRGPWHAEKRWHLPTPEQGAWLSPPIGHMLNGPCGFAYNPGTGMDKSYDQHFFLVEFRAGTGRSGIQSFGLKSKGAGFEHTDLKWFLRGLSCTDLDFGYDGKIYVSDWAADWGPRGKGRIYTVTHDDHSADSLLKELQSLFAKGIPKLTSAKQAKLLSHPDMRVRQRAQFALADKGGEAVTLLAEAAHESPNLLARLHGIWGVGQVARRETSAATHLLPLLADPEEEVRAQAARALGESHTASAYKGLEKLLADESLHVQSLAAISIGKLKNPDAIEPLVALLERNNNQDPWLRHSAIMGLYRLDAPEAVLKYAKHPSAAVRQGLVVVLRRHQHPAIAQFLLDKDPVVVAEAGIGIYDHRIDAAMPALAALAENLGEGKATFGDPLARRILSANFMLGGVEAARNIAQATISSRFSDLMKVEALEILLDWTAPNGRERVNGFWRPLSERPSDAPRAALLPLIKQLIANGVTSELAARLATKYVLFDGPILVKRFDDPTLVPAERAEALKSLVTLDHPRLKTLVQKAIADTNVIVRIEGLRQLAQRSPVAAVKTAADFLESQKIEDQQATLAVLSTIKAKSTEALLATWTGRLLKGDVDPQIELDLMNTVETIGSVTLKGQLRTYREKLSSDSVAGFPYLLQGGDAVRGEHVFFHKMEASCVQCHKIKRVGGTAGPELTKLGEGFSRSYILESILFPDAKIAKGFENTTVEMIDGTVHVGFLKKETNTEIDLHTLLNKKLVIEKSMVKARTRLPSSMPPSYRALLTRSDIRDLVEFLSTKK